MNETEKKIIVQYGKSMEPVTEHPVVAVDVDENGAQTQYHFFERGDLVRIAFRASEINAGDTLQWSHSYR